MYIIYILLVAVVIGYCLARFIKLQVVRLALYLKLIHQIKQIITIIQQENRTKLNKILKSIPFPTRIIILSSRFFRFVLSFLSRFTFIYSYYFSIDQILFSIYVGSVLDASSYKQRTAISHVYASAFIEDKLDFSLLALSATLLGLGAFSYFTARPLEYLEEDSIPSTEFYMPSSLPDAPQIPVETVVPLTKAESGSFLANSELSRYISCHHPYFYAEDVRNAVRLLRILVQKTTDLGMFQEDVIEHHRLHCLLPGLSNPNTQPAIRKHLNYITNIEKSPLKGYHDAFSDQCKKRGDRILAFSDSDLPISERVKVLGKERYEDLTPEQKEYVGIYPEPMNKMLEPSPGKTFALDVYRNDPANEYRRLKDGFDRMLGPNSYNYEELRSTFRDAADPYIAYRNYLDSKKPEYFNDFFYTAGNRTFYKYTEELHEFRAQVLKTIMKGINVHKSRTRGIEQLYAANYDPLIMHNTYLEFKKQVRYLNEFYYDMSFYAHLPEMACTHSYINTNNAGDLFNS